MAIKIYIFYKVWLVQDKKKNDHFALKIQKSKKSYSESAIDELELLRDLNSHCEDEKWLQFVKEFNDKIRDGSWINKDKSSYQWFYYISGLRDEEEVEGAS